MASTTVASREALPRTSILCAKRRLSVQLGLLDGKTRLLRAVSHLSRAFAVCVPSRARSRFGHDVRFFRESSTSFTVPNAGNPAGWTTLTSGDSGAPSRRRDANCRAPQFS